MCDLNDAESSTNIFSNILHIRREYSVPSIDRALKVH